jgi:hypothetical protein
MSPSLCSRYRAFAAVCERGDRITLGRRRIVERKERPLPIAYIQEFPIVDGDTSTTNYDAVAAKLDLHGAAPQGLLLHSAGFDHDAGVFRIFDVWQTREDGERFTKEKLEPIIDAMIATATESGEEFAPPAREGWYELHDSMTG